MICFKIVLQNYELFFSKQVISVEKYIFLEKMYFESNIMKKILGLDLGTNSIGWALIEADFESKQGKILGSSSRIIPMEQGMLASFSGGKPLKTQTADRTHYRVMRHLLERSKLRRERLHRVLNVLGFLPEHYSAEIDFEKHLGQFVSEKEPKLPWKKNENGTFEFLFKRSFLEMVEDFKINSQEVKIPYDWTIYYLRKKALSKKIEKEELAWILLNFNQKRGYYQLRGEEENENPNKLVEYHSLKIVDVVADNPNARGDVWYNLQLENGWIYRRSSKTPLFDWKDKVRDFIVTTELNDDGTIKIDKEGYQKRSFRAPSEDDWTLIKKKTESDIERTQKTIGTYIYDTLVQNPTQKIRGKLVKTIERQFYKKELELILKKQIELQPELFTEDLFNDSIRELYRSNITHQYVLSSKDFVFLFVNDILFYQRPLRSQKASIGNCSFEFRQYRDKDGNEIREYIKACPKSNPYYQEFRLWQWLYNIKIYTKDDDIDVTTEFITNNEDKVNLFDFLNARKFIEQKYLIEYLLKDKGYNKKDISKYRWNYVEDKKYPCNETRTLILNRLTKVVNFNADFLTFEIEQKLWHIIYSVTDKNEYEKALKTFADRYALDVVSFVDSFKSFPPFKSEYGSFSEKAIKKLLPLMRLGKYWNLNYIDEKTKYRIDKIITGEYDETIKDIVRNKAINLTSELDFQGLQLWLAQYIVYDRHSESDNLVRWNSVQDLEKYLQDFKQHSLRNPIVEQVVTETLRLVKDIWLKYGLGAADFFKEIHIELGREMKNTAEDRKKITNQITENENVNHRIKALLAELQNDASVENVRPYSPTQQEILKIYEDGILNSGIEIPEYIRKITATSQPSSSDLQRYRLWLEQKYRSPYTGQPIPLGKLFTSAYEIEHIIPQSRYFDDSFSNKVICEAAVNKLKDKLLGFEFIRSFHGQIVETGFGNTVKIFEESEYKDFIKLHYVNNYSKRAKLFLDEIPEKMIERQLNDTRYISKFVTQILSNIVRESTGDNGVNSKNVIPVNGKITSVLKKDWGLNDVWNDLILQRFKRMNQLTEVHAFTTWNEQYQKYLPTVPLEFSRGFQKKRIDHRHHAMDALVIACATRDHINLLNNKHARTNEERYDLQRKLRNFIVVGYADSNNQIRTKNIPKEFKKPWSNFTVDAQDELAKIVVSFKQNLRVINKATNRYERIKDGKKIKDYQKGLNWAIRKPLHKEFVFGKVNLPWVKVPKGKINVAIRRNLDISFDYKKILTITDTGIQNILRKYLASKDSNSEVAFSPEGIEDMNKNIWQYNDGKMHKPILKVRTFEVGSRFQLGQTGNKKDKYVEAAKGTNLFFAIYIDEAGNRSYETVPLNIVIERLKQGLNAVPEINDKGKILLFYLSPNDLVYVPTVEEIENNRSINFVDLGKEQTSRIYKMVSSSGSQCFFLQQFVANTIVDKMEFSALNKMERSITGEMIKDICIKLNVDRLGNVTSISL